MARVVVGEQVAQQLGDEALLLEQHRRGPARLHLLPDLGPDLVKVGQVADDVFLRAAAGGGPDDDATGKAVLLAELADDAAETPALFSRINLPRHADVIDRRHEDEEASGHGDVRGQARALGAEGLLDDLDEDVLAFFQQVFDLGLGAIVAVTRPAALAPAALGPGIRDG